MLQNYSLESKSLRQTKTSLPGGSLDANVTTKWTKIHRFTNYFFLAYCWIYAILKNISNTHCVISSTSNVFFSKHHAYHKVVAQFISSCLYVIGIWICLT
jgi:hypothetical protein